MSNTVFYLHDSLSELSKIGITDTNFDYEEHVYPDGRSVIIYTSHDNMKYVLAVISKNHGAGFSSCDEKCEELATHPKVVIQVLKGKSFGTDYLKHLGFEESLFDFDDLSIAFVPISCIWKIREYDGIEWIEIFCEKDWFKPLI